MPVQLIFNCIRNSDDKLLQLYHYLKISSSGKLREKELDYEEIKNVMNIKSLKTIKTYLGELKRKDWIGYNKKSDNYFIRSFDKVNELENVQSRIAAVFSIKYFSNFKAWCGAVMYAYLYRRTRWSKFKESASKLEKANQTQRTAPLFINNLYKKIGWDFNRNKPEPPYFPIATTGFSKYFKISIGQASKLKKLAYDAGFIDVRKNYENTSIPLEEKELFKKYGDTNLANKIRVKNGNVVFQQIDTILPRIALSKRKKRKTYS